MCDSTLEIERSDGETETLRCNSQYEKDDERHPENCSTRVFW